MKPVRFHPEAEAELQEASAFYEGRRPGLGEGLESEVQEAVERIARMPRSFPPYGDGGARKCVLRRFPYTIFFLELEEIVWVAAIAHQKRQPDYWAHRQPD